MNKKDRKKMYEKVIGSITPDVSGFICPKLRRLIKTTSEYNGKDEDIVKKFPEFGLFYPNDGLSVWFRFGDYEEDTNGIRVFVLQMCIEMCK